MTPCVGREGDSVGFEVLGLDHSNFLLPDDGQQRGGWGGGVSNQVHNNKRKSLST